MQERISFLLNYRGFLLSSIHLRVFEVDPMCQGIIFSINPQEEAIFSGLIDTYGLGKVKGTCARRGGTSAKCL